MTTTPLLLIGAGGHARTVIDIIEQIGQYHIAGLIERPELRGSHCMGYAVTGHDDDLPALIADCPHAFIAIGQIGAPGPRQRLYEQLKALGATLPVIHAPSSVVSAHAALDAGVLVGQGAIVQAGARIGANTIINSRALVEHDAEISEHCHISTGAIVNGGTYIGAGSFVGSGAILREGIRIGAGSFICAGALVTRDCPPGSFMKRTS